uniref:Sperm surface protein Sp17 n=1 Tax=Cyprinodon variegatus TaxID=28743 RepID=A0A3Q2CI89_CYPVA
MLSMSVPFSNTHLRVPRGFGTLLEGLAREVLRDQPDNIPAYAAQYFDKLLKKREGNLHFNIFNARQTPVTGVCLFLFFSWQKVGRILLSGLPD